MYAFNMKNAFNLYVEKELIGVVEWTQLHSFMNNRSHFWPRKYNGESAESNLFVVDVDSCFDRLYGGFDVDWKCGGEWMPMHNMMLNLRRCAERHNIQFVFMFNGTMPDEAARPHWSQQQLNMRKSFFKVFRSPACRELRYWTEPAMLGEQLAVEVASYSQRDHPSQSLAEDRDEARQFRNDNKAARTFFHYYTTVDDHQQELVRFCHLNRCRGIITSDYELIFMLAVEKFRFQRSSHNLEFMRVYLGRNLKFCQNFGLSSFEVDVRRLVDGLGLSAAHAPYFAVLAGLSHHYPDEFLIKFYEVLIDKPNLAINTQIIAFKIIHEVAGFCKSFKDFERFDGNLMESVTGFVEPLKRDLAAKCFCRALGRLKRSVMEGLLDYFPLEGHSFDRFRFQQASAASALAVAKPGKSKFEYAVVARSSQPPEDAAGVQQAQNYEAWLKGLKRSHVHCRSHWWTYHLLVKRRIFLPVTFEPEPSTSMLTADELYRPLRTALYSILFGSAFANEGPKEWSVTEYFFDTIEDKMLYQEIKFTSNHELNASACCSDKFKARRKRMDVFLRAVNCPSHLAKPMDLNHRSENRIGMACLLLRHLLRHRQYLCAKDIRAFLAVFIVAKRENAFKSINAIMDAHKDRLKFHARPMHLAHLFMRGFEVLHALDKACGSEYERAFYAPRLFHGRFFHMCYCLYGSDEERCIGLTKEENSELDEWFFSITRDLTECLLIDPSLCPYEIKPSASSRLNTPINLNQSFFGSPNHSYLSDAASSRPGVVPSMLHLGRGRGILAFAEQKTLRFGRGIMAGDWSCSQSMRGAESDLDESRTGYRLLASRRPKPKEESKKARVVEEEAFLDYDRVYEFYHDHYSTIELYRQRQEEAVRREAEAKTPKALRITCTELLARIGIYETPEERREQMLQLKKTRLETYLREQLKPDANNKVKFSQLLPIAAPFHRGISREQLSKWTELTRRDEAFLRLVAEERPASTLMLADGHRPIPDIAFRPYK